MKRTNALLMAAAIAFGTMGISPAFAEHGGPHPERQGGPAHEHGKARFFEEADGDKDGFLTRDEMRAAQEKKLDGMFEKLDTDKDGKLSKDELKKGHEEMRKKMHERFKERGPKPARGE